MIPAVTHLQNSVLRMAKGNDCHGPTSKSIKESLKLALSFSIPSDNLILLCESTSEQTISSEEDRTSVGCLPAIF